MQALKEFGPMTRSEVLAYLKLNRDNYGATLTRLCATNRVHISHYVHESEGQREYPRAVYAYGPGRNAKKPPPKERNAVVREYVARRVSKFRASSVFNMGLQVKDIKQRLRGST